MLHLALLLAACSHEGRPPLEKTQDTGCEPADAMVFYLDADGDGWGSGTTTRTCTAPDDYIEQGGDCDELDPDVFPGAEERCNGADDDCDGEVDEDLAISTWYADGDGDGFGDPSATVQGCEAPEGYTDDGEDCDDDDDGVNPGAQEVCANGKDDDCDGSDGAPCSIELGEADARYTGEVSFDWAGHPISTAGDTNGDGYDDILVGAYLNDDGAAYLVLGGPSPGDLSLADADAKYSGETAGDRAGGSATAGDTNGDGYDDILVGAYYNDERGAAYLVLGGPSPGDLSLRDADVKYVGEASDDRAGSSVSTAGDANGDGYDDVLVGAPGHEEGGEPAGAAYLVLGGL